MSDVEYADPEIEKALAAFAAPTDRVDADQVFRAIAAQALPNLANGLGLRRISSVTPSKGGLLVEASGADYRTVRLQVSGATTGPYSLKGVAGTYVKFGNASAIPRYESAGLDDSPRSSVTYVVTRDVRNRTAISDSNRTRTELELTTGLLPVIQRMPHPTVPRDDREHFISFKEFLQWSQRDSVENRELKDLLRPTDKSFGSAKQVLAERAHHIGLGEINANNTFAMNDSVSPLHGSIGFGAVETYGQQEVDTQTRFGFSDPFGCLCPLGWDEARVVTEFGPTDMKTILELAASCDYVPMDLMLLNIGVAQRLKVEQDFARDPKSDIAIAKARLDCAQRCFQVGLSMQPDTGLDNRSATISQ